MNRRRNGLGVAALFLALVGLTFFLCFRGQDPRTWTGSLTQADPRWLGVGVLAMACFFALEARQIQLSLALFGEKSTCRSCVTYSLTGFFFSSVTPSASGGQPMQLVAMGRDGHGAAPSALALLTTFFTFQGASVLWALTGFFLHRKELLALGGGVRLCFWVGVALSLALPGCLFLALGSKRLLPALWKGLMTIVRRLCPKKAADLADWGGRQWEELQRCAGCYRSHKKELVRLLLLSLLRLGLYHSVPFWIYGGLGLSGASLLDVMGMQGVLFVSVSSLPLPGAVGLSEGGFLLLYQGIFPEAMLPGAMVLSRLVSFYLPLVGSGIFMAILAAKRERQTARGQKRYPSLPRASARQLF